MKFTLVILGASPGSQVLVHAMKEPCQRTTCRDLANTPRFLVHKIGQFLLLVTPYFNHAKELQFGVLDSNETLMPRLIKKIG